jgi:hypothetical protein
MEVWNTQHRWFQSFKFVKNYIINLKSRKVLEVQGGINQEGRNVGIANRNHQPYQKWRVVYLDTMARERIKGLNSNFGFFINRPFYIVSKMWMNRVVEMVGGRNLVIKTRVMNRKSQQWFFDQKSKTIKSN